MKENNKLEPATVCDLCSAAAVRIVLALGAVFLAFLCWNSAFSTGRLAPGGIEDVAYTPDHGLVKLAAAVFCAAMIFLLRRWLVKIPTRIMGRAVQLYFLVMSLIFVFGGKCNPVYDQRYVMDIAARWRIGDFSFLSEEYMQLYPHQLGLAAYETLQAMLVGDYNYLFFGMLNCFWLAAMIGALYRTLDLLFEEQGLTNTFLLFLLPCFPAIFYCTFNYGEISSLALGTIAVWCQVLYLKKEKWQYMVPCAASIMFAVLLRKNTLILLIAMVLVQLVYALHKRSIRTAALILAPIAAVVIGQQGLIALCNANDTYQVPEGAPASTWIAMGMQEGDSLSGAFNGYTYDISRELNYDHDLIDADAQEQIREAKAGFLSDPGYALHFYYHKLMQQWNEPTYNMFVMTHDTEGRPAWLENFWTGSGYGQMYGILNFYQTLVYLFALAEIILQFKKANAPKMIFALYFVGGFLFSLLWEAKARYMLAYFILLIPLAGAGLYHLAGLAAPLWKRLAGKRTGKVPADPKTAA